MPQCMLQSLCQHFYGMPHHRRSALLKMALSAMKAPSTLAVAVDLLLAHSFAAHEIEASTASGANVDASSSEESKSDVMILLSKSAHRRARKELKASVPEELFPHSQHTGDRGHLSAEQCAPTARHCAERLR